MNSNKASFQLLEAARKGGIQQAKLALAQGADPDFSDGDGKTALHRSAERGDVQLMEILLEQRVKINAVDVGGHTPLHLASVLPDEKTVCLLLSRGADPNRFSSKKGYSPLGFAVLVGNPEVAEHLLLASADPRRGLPELPAPPDRTERQRAWAEFFQNHREAQFKSFEEQRTNGTLLEILLEPLGKFLPQILNWMAAGLLPDMVYRPLLSSGKKFPFCPIDPEHCLIGLQIYDHLAGMLSNFPYWLHQFPDVDLTPLRVRVAFSDDGESPVQRYQRRRV